MLGSLISRGGGIEACQVITIIKNWIQEFTFTYYANVDLPTLTIAVLPDLLTRIYKPSSSLKSVSSDITD